MIVDGPAVAVVGAGPAGLIGAEVLARAGLQVTVFEQRRSVANKFLLAGRGGLNITHAEPIDRFLLRYGDAPALLTDAVEAFSPSDLRAWCADLGQPTFSGSSGRVFPETFRATPLLREWLARLAVLGVRIEVRHRWSGWTDEGELRFERDSETVVVAPKATLFAVGGASWPRVGSDGGWVRNFEHAGANVTPLEPANCGLLVPWTPIMRDRFAGTPIKNAVFSVGERAERGDAIVSGYGIEGGPIYALGPAVRRALLGAGHVTLRADLHPDSTHEELTERLSRRRSGATVSRWLRSAGVSAVSIGLLRDATNNAIAADAPAVAAQLKDVPISITGLAPIARAISTAGGLRFEEVDEHFMLRSMPGTFVAGEMLDWEAPTGGYLLQACFSTGVAAARGILRWLG